MQKVSIFILPQDHQKNSMTPCLTDATSAYRYQLRPALPSLYITESKQERIIYIHVRRRMFVYVNVCASTFPMKKFINENPVKEELLAKSECEQEQPAEQLRD